MVGCELVREVSGEENDDLHSLEPADVAPAKGEKVAEGVVGAQHQQEAEEEVGARAG